MDTLFHSFSFPLAEVLPSIDEAAEYLHLTGQEEHPGFIFMKEKMEELAHTNLYAKGGYRLFTTEQLDIHSGTMILMHRKLYLNRQVTAYLKGATYVALFECTAGAVFSEQYREYNAQGDILEAYIADALGSLTVEKAMDKIQEKLRDEMTNYQLKISTRYSPGYCNWPLTEQQTLFELVGDNPTGITLSDSCLMYPTKSVSGIIGIGPDMKAREYGCVTCSNKNCIYRRIVQNDK